MKRYILLSILFSQSLLQSMQPVQVVPTGLTNDSNAIVDAIKRYTDLTEADVTQYKLLWLGDLSTVGAFIAGAASAIGAGAAAYQKAGAIQTIAPTQVPSWMTNALVLAGLGSAGAGYASYKVLSPRLRSSVLDKIKRFIEVCEGLKPEGSHYTIAYNDGTTIYQIKPNLPLSWQAYDNVAVYNALDNLLMQAKCAVALLNQLDSEGKDEAVQAMLGTINKNYIPALEKNGNVYYNELQTIIAQEQDKERRLQAEQLQGKMQEAQLAHLQAGANLQTQTANLTQAKTIETYGTMFKNTLQNTWSGLNYMYKNKEKILYRLGVLSAAAFGGYTYLKSKLGFGQQQ
ncbi:MAG TPA: hypothetical protein VKU36_00575 [Candidatus Babeliales bacterium]|nr:hypothetical protein [Candidatus Babeliales bacterium]